MTKEQRLNEARNKIQKAAEKIVTVEVCNLRGQEALVYCCGSIAMVATLLNMQTSGMLKTHAPSIAEMLDELGQITLLAASEYEEGGVLYADDKEGI